MNAPNPIWWILGAGVLVLFGVDPGAVLMGLLVGLLVGDLIQLNKR